MKIDAIKTGTKLAQISATVMLFITVTKKTKDMVFYEQIMVYTQGDSPNYEIHESARSIESKKWNMAPNIWRPSKATSKSYQTAIKRVLQ